MLYLKKSVVCTKKKNGKEVKFMSSFRSLILFWEMSEVY